MELLITLLVIVGFAVFICWLIDMLPLPPPLNMIAKCIVALVALMKLLTAAGIAIPVLGF